MKTQDRNGRASAPQGGDAAGTVQEETGQVGTKRAHKGKKGFAPTAPTRIDIGGTFKFLAGLDAHCWYKAYWMVPQLKKLGFAAVYRRKDRQVMLEGRSIETLKERGCWVEPWVLMNYVYRILTGEHNPFHAGIKGEYRAMLEELRQRHRGK